MTHDLVGKFSVEKFPKLRRVIVDTVEEGRKRHHMKGLLELDVTDGFKKIKEYKKETGQNLSFTGWITKCVAECIRENPKLYAKRKRNKIFYFEDIDISLMVERIIDGKKFPIVYVLRKVDTKNLQEITKEIQTAKKISKNDYLKSNNTKRLKMFVTLPKFLRYLFFWRKMKHNPFFQKKNAGLINITAVGMFGELAGWPLINSTYPISLALGSITKKPWVVDDQIKIRDILHLSIYIDHDTVDGAPAVRFIQQFADFIQSGDFIF